MDNCKKTKKSKNCKSSKMIKTKELGKKRVRKCTEKKLMVQLHHFANLSKSTTTTKADVHLSGETKALLQNDYFRVLNQTEFVAKPFVINSNSPVKHNKKELFAPNQLMTLNDVTHSKKEFKDLVSRKFKAKDRRPKNPFAVACLDINSMISIKDYKRVYCKKILENRLFINGILVYDKLKQHYSGVNVSRNCLKKKFITKLNKASKEIPEMGTDAKDKDCLQDVIEFYENQENDINMFNREEIVPDVYEERPVTPEQYFAPESYHTPPEQRLIPVDLSKSTSDKYQTVFYEKDSQSGKASLFQIPESYQVSGQNVNVNRSVLKRIDITNDIPCSSTSSMKSRVEAARLQLQINDLQVFVGKKCPKKRLFENYSVDAQDDFQPLANPDDELFVRPIFSPREFTEFKKKTQTYSPMSNAKQKYNKLLTVNDESASSPLHSETYSSMSNAKQKYLKVDELDSFKDVSKIQTPGQHPYFPFVQFNR